MCGRDKHFHRNRYASLLALWSELWWFLTAILNNEYMQTSKWPFVCVIVVNACDEVFWCDVQTVGEIIYAWLIHNLMLESCCCVLLQQLLLLYFLRLLLRCSKMLIINRAVIWAICYRSRWRCLGDRWLVMCSEHGVDAEQLSRMLQNRATNINGT